MEKLLLGKPGIDERKIRSDFPILSRQINGKQLAYLDNAATTQKPNQVIDVISDYYRNSNANIHRAVHTLGNEATEMYEGARGKIASFINASPREVIFTRNATEAINLVAFSFGAGLKKGDEIITTLMEHHSNIVPWQMLESNGVKVRYVDVDEEGNLKLDQYNEFVNENTKIIAVAHASNVLGTINPVSSIAKIAHDAGALLVVDGAQGAPHMPVDVHALDADFYAFSGHKMLGPTGIGVLYGRRNLLEGMQPFLRGGDMIKEVYTTHTTFNDLPHKFEAGTPNIADTIGFGAALDYLANIGMENVLRHERALTKYALEKLSGINGLKIYGPLDTSMRTGAVSFNLADIHSHDVASILDDEGIAIRSGHSCAMPLMTRLGVPSVARASVYIYNTKEEIERLADALEKAASIFKIG